MENSLFKSHSVILYDLDVIMSDDLRQLLTVLMVQSGPDCCPSLLTKRMLWETLQPPPSPRTWWCRTRDTPGWETRPARGCCPGSARSGCCRLCWRPGEAGGEGETWETPGLRQPASQLSAAKWVEQPQHSPLITRQSWDLLKLLTHLTQLYSKALRHGHANNRYIKIKSSANGFNGFNGFSDYL